MTDTELLIRETLADHADQAELVDLVRSAKARSRELGRGQGTSWRGQGGALASLRNRRTLAFGGLTAVVVLFATAFALGGATGTHPDASVAPSSVVDGALTPQVATGRQPLANGKAAGGAGGSASHGPPQGVVNGPGSASTSSGTAVPQPAASAVPPTVANGAEQPVVAPRAGTPAESSVTATRIVKTGALGLRVAKGDVPDAVTKLTRLATSVGGYVSQSRTGNVQGSMYGDLTLRVPVANFESTIAAAEQFGKETSLTTNTEDVTGKVVDLQARLSALRHTRQTYLTILSDATTIGQTLTVQQRVNDVQRQIEELQGGLKVLRSQSADATLQVSITQPGAATTVIVTHPPRHGIDKAWHTSIDRFSRGIDSIVAGLGPLLLALLIVAFFVVLGTVGYRAIRRVTT